MKEGQLSKRFPPSLTNRNKDFGHNLSSFTLSSELMSDEKCVGK